MNSIQLNKRRMYDATVKVLDNNQAHFEAVPALVEAHRQLKEQIARIDQNRQIQEVDSTGLTRNKVLLREELINLLFRVSSALTAFATAQNEVALKAKASYTHTDLKRSSDRILCDIADMIRGFATPVVAELQKYFVGNEEIARLEQLTSAFAAAMPLKRVAVSVSKVSTGNISGVYEEIDQLLKTKIDTLIGPFQFTQPDFFNAYRNGRLIVDYSGRGKTAAPGTATV